MIDMLEKADLTDRTKDRLPEDYKLRYFTEMEVAGLMGFPKHFSFSPELSTRQVFFPMDLQDEYFFLALCNVGKLLECRRCCYDDQTDDFRR